MSNFDYRSLTSKMSRGGVLASARTQSCTFQITYCLVKQKFFITFHKLRLFIRDHNFVLCIFFIFNISALCSTLRSLACTSPFHSVLFLLFYFLFYFFLSSFAGEEIETLLLFCIIFVWQSKKETAILKQKHSYATATAAATDTATATKCIQLKLRQTRRMSTPCQEEMSLRLCGKAN